MDPGTAAPGAIELAVPDGPAVARYSLGGHLDPGCAPRPFLHPVRTLGGLTVTAVHPDDHPWHLGVSVAVPDVAGANLWGGPTFVAGRGYVERPDHGRIRHDRWEERAADGFVEALRWEDGGGALLLTERRSVRARPAAPGGAGRRAWILRWAFSLANPTGSPVALRSPTTNGRPGAAYGGFFWRAAFAPGCRVRSEAGEGEEAANGSRARWLALSGAVGDAATTATLAFAARGAADPWFVRADEYPGVGASLAVDEPLVVPPGGSVARAVDVAVADGALGDDEVTALLEVEP